MITRLAIHHDLSPAHARRSERSIVPDTPTAGSGVKRAQRYLAVSNAIHDDGESEQARVRASSTPISVTDGPFAETKELRGG